MNQGISKVPCILVVDDTLLNLQIVGEILSGSMDCEISLATDGVQALQVVRDIQPDLILLDVMMPGMSGIEVCEHLKQEDETSGIPVIFLTAKAETEDIVHGFKAGAVDYVVKPFRAPELLARVQTQLKLKTYLDLVERHNRELQEALDQIRTLKGMLPICSYCKKIRDDQGYWEQLEAYIVKNSDAQFSHGICPDCLKEQFPDLYRKKMGLS